MSTARNSKEELMKICGQADHIRLQELLNRSSFSNEVFGRAWRHVIEHDHQKCFDVLLAHIRRSNNPKASLNSAALDCVHFNKDHFLTQLLNHSLGKDTTKVISYLMDSLGSERSQECALVLLPHLTLIEDQQLERALGIMRDNPHLRQSPYAQQLVTGMLDRRDKDSDAQDIVMKYIDNVYALYARVDFCIWVATHPDFENAALRAMQNVEAKLDQQSLGHADDTARVAFENIQRVKAACSQVSLQRHISSDDKHERHVRKL